MLAIQKFDHQHLILDFDYTPFLILLLHQLLIDALYKFCDANGKFLCGSVEKVPMVRNINIALGTNEHKLFHSGGSVKKEHFLFSMKYEERRKHY